MMLVTSILHAQRVSESIRLLMAHPSAVVGVWEVPFSTTELETLDCIALDSKTESHMLSLAPHSLELLTARDTSATGMLLSRSAVCPNLVNILLRTLAILFARLVNGRSAT